MFQDRSGLGDFSENSEAFGWSLAAADFDNDGYDDLAIGVPYETCAGGNCGAVHLVYGSSGGLNGDRDKVWYQGDSGVLGTAEDGDSFGFSLAAGRFGSDPYYDLAVGAPGEDIGAIGMMQAVECTNDARRVNYHPRHRAASHSMSAAEVDAIYPKPSLEVMYRQNIQFVDPSDVGGYEFPGFAVDVPQLDEV